MASPKQIGERWCPNKNQSFNERTEVMDVIVKGGVISLILRAILLIAFV